MIYVFRPTVTFVRGGDGERDRREKALSTPLDASNKGVAMMQKAGYKGGDSLGKSGSDGIVDPGSQSVDFGHILDKFKYSTPSGQTYSLSDEFYVRVRTFVK